MDGCYPVAVLRTSLLLAVVLCVLAGLAVVGDLVLRNTTARWFERDLDLRARLAVGAAKESLEQRWLRDPEGLRATLQNIARDERIMGAAACLKNGHPLVATELYPAEFSCRSVQQARLREKGDPEHWSERAELPSGPVLLSVLGLSSAGVPLGDVVLVHDLSFVVRREASTRAFLVVSYFVLALITSLVTLVGARYAWRRWRREMLRALSGGGTREFEPLVRDVRHLVDRLLLEAGHEARAGSWSPARLRETLVRYLQGERVVILANREPYIHEKTEMGVRVQHPASGLVTALEPVMRACSGVWVAHGSGSADRQTVDAHDRVRVPPGEESYLVRRVWLSKEEEDGYYYGFANEGLWPLCHIAHARPSFRAEDWAHYQAVNQRFADAVCEEVDSDDPIVLVQDYHFALAPRMIRKRLPRATILSFWHIPWPNVERIGICPWREELLQGLLGSSIVGFHTAQHCRNFIEAVDTFLESRIDRESNAIVQGQRRTLVRPYPISIEWPVHWLDQVPSVEECRRGVRAELGLAPDALLGVGVDRLDYTKGIEERFAAVNALLASRPELRGRFVFVQLAAPSRTKIQRYHELNERVEELARTINQRWAQGEYRPIHLLHAHHEPAAVFRYYRAAELCYVSSLHDGMNLVAKEFVAARDDGLGVLVLSQFTGAARDLTEALIVNPYDTEEAASALAAALEMPASEQKERMLSMRRMVSEFNVYRWAGRMIIDAAELRRRDRLADRLSGWRGALALEHP